MLGEAECLCFVEAAAFPFKGKVGGPICAVCCLQCVPNMGCMQPSAKKGGAPESATMER